MTFERGKKEVDAYKTRLIKKTPPYFTIAGKVLGMLVKSPLLLR